MSKLIELKIGERVGKTLATNIIHVMPWTGKDGVAQFQVKLADGCYYYLSEADGKNLMEEWENAMR